MVKISLKKGGKGGGGGGANKKPKASTFYGKA
jgi:hypothetical protein